MNKFRKPHGKNRTEGGGGFVHKGERPSFGPKPAGKFGMARSFGRPVLHDAVCSHCGKATQVPFRPNGQKPVFCKQCFNTDRANSPSPVTKQTSPAIFNAPRPQADDKRIDDLRGQVEALHVKMDRIWEVLAVSHAKKEETPSASSEKPEKPKKKAKAPTKKK